MRSWLAGQDVRRFPIVGWAERRGADEVKAKNRRIELKLTER